MLPPQTIAGKVHEKFSSQVLAAVAQLSQEEIESEGGLPPRLVESVLGNADLRVGKPCYSIEADCKAYLHFDLHGDATLFREHFGSLLGKQWSCDGGKASVVMPLNLASHQFRSAVPALRQELVDAVRAYLSHFAEAHQALYRMGDGAYWNRFHVERAMQELNIPKEMPKPPKSE